METISLRTSDGFSLKALHGESNVLADSKPRRGAVLLHMMPATKESWIGFAEQLVPFCEVVAPDLRGHGESDGGPAGFKAFSNEAHQASRNDVAAAVEYLRAKGIQDIVLVGASIGANLALQYAAEHPEISACILLSPGINYYGIETLPLVERLRPTQRLLIAASEDDMRTNGSSAATMAQQLYLAAPDSVQKNVIIYHAAGHGTNMFGKETPDLAQEICKVIGVA